MKKQKILVALLLVVCLLLGACATDLDKASKNLDTYVIAATFDEQNKKVSVVQTVEYTHRAEKEIEQVKFRLYANAYADETVNPIVPVADKVLAYKNGYSYGQATIDSVYVDEQSVAFVLEGDGTVLSVALPQTVFNGDKVTIELVYEITLANIWHRLGYGDNTVNLGNWFAILCPIDENGWQCSDYSPLGDPYLSQVANYNVTFYVPNGYTVAHSGNLIATEQRDNLTVYNIEGKCIRDFALVLSTKFTHKTATVGDCSVNYYYYDDTANEQTLTLITQAIEYFNKLFGNYPYSQLSVCQTDFCYGGMEYPTLVYVAPNSEQSVYNQTVVHEIAHQWLYGVIGSDQVSNAWQDEGFTEFVTLTFFDSYPQYNLAMNEQIALTLAAYTTYVDVIGSYLPAVDTSMNKSLHEYVGAQEYLYMNYVKGCLVFNDLYKLLGKNKFEQGCKKYYQENMFKVASVQSLVQAFSQAYGSDLSGWFSAYVSGNDVLAVPKE